MVNSLLVAGRVFCTVFFDPPKVEIRGLSPAPFAGHFLDTKVQDNWWVVKVASNPAGQNSSGT